MSLGDGASISGKLVWKVDWPMRWAYEHVDFESAGEDHHAPSSSYASGMILAQEIFHTPAPYSFPYSFVGLAGVGSKMSGSVGGAATPAMALNILEPPMLRWLYARRLPSKSFAIDLSSSAVLRLYDEWDRLNQSARSRVDRHLLNICLQTAAGPVEHSTRPVSFRMLSSLADITLGNRAQIERLVREHLVEDDLPSDNQLLRELEPRLTAAINFAETILPPADRTVVRTTFNDEVWITLDREMRQGLRMLDEQVDESWTLEGLTRLIYSVPKLLCGLPPDAKATPELKKAQRAFFSVVYRMLCSKDTGPRLPTLLLSIGQEHVHELLSPRS
jgi:lysyl-tRNA synthetase class 1